MFKNIDKFLFFAWNSFDTKNYFPKIFKIPILRTQLK